MNSPISMVNPGPITCHQADAAAGRVTCGVGGVTYMRSRYSVEGRLVRRSRKRVKLTPAKADDGSPSPAGAGSAVIGRCRGAGRGAASGRPRSAPAEAASAAALGVGRGQQRGWMAQAKTCQPSPIRAPVLYGAVLLPPFVYSHRLPADLGAGR